MQRDFSKSECIFGLFLQTPVYDKIIISSKELSSESENSFDREHTFEHLSIVDKKNSDYSRGSLHNILDTTEGNFNESFDKLSASKLKQQLPSHKKTKLINPA
jgi:hypothetical protein